jgi:hypothetical protein
VSPIAPALQAFFTDRLITQRNASPRTIAAYRDTFRLLLGFAHEQTGKQPFQLDIDDLDAPLIGAFLDHLEDQRANSVRSRNTRLAAIHSLFRFAALRHPEHAALDRPVLALPPKRCDRAVVSFLNVRRISVRSSAAASCRCLNAFGLSPNARAPVTNEIDRNTSGPLATALRTPWLLSLTTAALTSANPTPPANSPPAQPSMKSATCYST